MQRIILGGGCFWGVQYYFDQVPGVVRTTVGYSGGQTDDPSYEQVCSHTTGHTEVVLVEFDETKINLPTILQHFFRLHNPTELNRQGPDVGDNYRSAIFYINRDQKHVAESIKNELQAAYDDPIVTEITRAGKFYPAEAYHQKFTQRTGRGMCHAVYEPLS